MNMQVREACYEYLGYLYESGIENMALAGPLIEEAFGVEQAEAQRVLYAWMQERKRREEDEQGDRK